MKFFVYILYSELHRKFYIGQTDNIESRLARHNAGTVKSTSPYRPWLLKLTIEKSSRAEAMSLEKKLKNLSKERIEFFIQKNSKG